MSPSQTCDFEIDGDFGVGAGQDWTTANVQPVSTDDIGNPDRTVFTQGSKELTPSTWATASGNPGVNTDISHVYAYSKICDDGSAIDGDAMAYFGFERVASSGTTDFTLELNKKPNKTLANGVSVPDRSEGDLALAIVQQGQGTWDVSALAYSWDATNSKWVAIDASGWFVGTSNQTDTTNPLQQVVVAGRFAEFSVDLSKLSTTCVTAFSALNLRSRASESITSSLKDFIDPVPLHVQGTCAELTIEKHDARTGALVGGASYTIEPDSTPGTTQKSLTVVDGGTNDPDNTADGIVHLPQVDPGTYTVTETDAPSGYFLPPPGDRSQTLTVAKRGSVTFRFDDTRKWQPLTATTTARATYDAAYAWAVDKSVDATTKKVAEGTPASFKYTVEVTQGARTTSDWKVSGTLTLTNPNSRPMTVTLDDALTNSGATCRFPGVDDVSGADGLQVVVAPSGQGSGSDYAYVCTVPNDPTAMSGTQTATATWSRADYPQTQSDVDDPANAPVARAQATADYTFTVVNEADKTVTVTDTQYTWDPAWTITWSGQGTKERRSYDKAFDGVAGRCTTYDNTARVLGDGSDVLATDSQSVQACVGKDLSVSKTVVSSYYRTYDWSLTKDVVGSSRKDVDGNGEATFSYKVTATGGKATDSRWAMSGVITVSNPNAWPVTMTDLTDHVDVGGGAACTVDKGQGLEVPATGKRTYDYTCTFDSKPSYDGVNTATATWDTSKYVSPDTSATGTADVVAANWAETSVDKTVTIVDDKTDPDHPVTLGTATWDGEGQSTSFTYDVTVTGRKGECVDYTNHAWIQELPGRGDSATVTACWPADLTVSKDVAATYDTTYFWDISKVVDRAYAEVGPGGTAPFTYTVVARPNGSQDSNWTMSGTITVSNPNTYKSVTATLSDAYDGGGVCTPASPTVEVPEATRSGGTITPGTASVGYTCAFDQKPAYTGTNTVTAAWDGGTATGTADVVFAQAGRTDHDVNVYDDLTDPNGTPKLLGRVGWDDSLADRTFTNTLDLGAAPGRCVDHTNTAWVDVTSGDTALLPGLVVAGLDPFAQQTVTVCEKAQVSVDKNVNASYDTRYLWDISKSVDKTSAEVDAGSTARFGYTVVARPNGSQDSNWTMSGTITVTNPNTYETAQVTLADVYDGGGVCTPESTSVVVPEATLSGDTVVPGVREVPYTCAFTNRPDYTGTNTVTATWDGQDITASKPVTFEQVGRTDYSVDVYDDLTDPNGTPKLLGHVSYDDSLADRTFTNTLDLGAATGTCQDYTNTAWVVVAGDDPTAHKTVRVCEKAPLTVTKNATASYDTAYFWDITKEVDTSSAEVGPGGTAPFTYTVVARPNGSQDSHWAMSGTITVANPNTYRPASVTLSDVYDGGGVCTPESTSVTVPADDSVRVPYTCTFTSRPEYTGTNTATASWDGEDYTGTAPVRFAQARTTDYRVDVYDDLTDPNGTPKLLGTVAWDDSLAQRTFTNTLDLGAAPGDCVEHTNTAWIPVEGKDPSAQQTVTVCEKALIVVSKDVTATYDTRYLWDISKDVDRTRAEVPAGDTAPFDYTVVARPNGSEDSNWAMSGTITVTNPNTYKTASVTLADVYDGGGVCTPQSTSIVVPEGGTTRVPYTCAFTTKPAYTGTNTVTATWEGQDITATKPVSFQQVGKTDYSVDVYDDFTHPQSAPTLLGTVTWDDPLADRTFTNTLDLGAAPGQCVDHTNTAWVDVTDSGVGVLAQQWTIPTDPSAQQTVTVCEKAPLQVTKNASASYDTTYLWDITKQVDRTSAEVGPGGTAPFTYTVVAKPNGSEDSNWAMSGTITVTNPNSYRTASVALKDVYDGGGACTPESTTVEVPASDSVTVPYTCSFSSAPEYAGTNTATATWEGQDYTGTAPVSFRQAGRTDYSVDVYDDLTKPADAPRLLGTVSWDDPLAKRTFTNTLDLGAKPGTCVDHTNTAWVDVTGDDPTAQRTVRVCEEAALDIAKTVDASFDRTYDWRIEKSVDQTQVEVTDHGHATFHYTVKAVPNGKTDSKYAMSGTVTVTNPNTYEGGDITAVVTDVPSVGGGAACTMTGGERVELAPEQSKTLAYTCSFTSRPDYQGSNEATATWTGPDAQEHSVSTGAVPVDFVATGHENRTVTVTDDETRPGADPVVLGEATWNAEGAPTEFTYDLTLDGVENTCQDYTNTATIEETDQAASATVTVCRQGDLVVAKTAEASYDRTYLWDITKQADRTRLDTSDGKTGTVSYTVGVTPTGYQDSGWEMTGSVTVDNPNQYKPVTVDLTDVPDLGEGASCAFDPTDDHVVEAGATRTFTYTCTFDQQPAYDGTNTVLVDWGAGQVSATTDAPFVVDQETNKTVTVTDDKTRPDAPAQVLGQATWDESGATTEFTYSLELAGKVNECETATNTATIVETSQQAQADVLVCGPDILGTHEERPPHGKPRPPVHILPELPQTGAPVSSGLWTMLGGLMVTIGAALLLVRRRRDSSWPE